MLAPPLHIASGALALNGASVRIRAAALHVRTMHPASPIAASALCAMVLVNASHGSALRATLHMAAATHAAIDVHAVAPATAPARPRSTAAATARVRCGTAAAAVMVLSLGNCRHRKQRQRQGNTKKYFHRNSPQSPDSNAFRYDQFLAPRTKH
jgi:hypothetical protein